MIWLEPTRYVCAWIKIAKGKNLIFNPQYSSDYQEFIELIEQAKNYNGNKQNFSEIFSYITQVKTKAKINPENFLHQVILSQLPNKEILSPEEYAQFLENTTPMLAERFLHYDSAHLGSSRHAQIGNVQAKGIGRNMLVSRVDYIHAWGGATRTEGVYSYLISNFLNIQLPLGASPTFKVDETTAGHVQILRKVESLRLAQYSSHLTPKEKQLIRQNLESHFKTNDPHAMANRVCHNFASLILLNGYNYSLIGENILLNGSIIDCESVYNGTNLQHLNFCLDICLNGPRANKVDQKKLNQWDYLSKLFNGAQDTMLCNSSVHGVMLMLNRIQEVYEDLYQIKLKDMGASFQRYIHKIHRLLSGSQFSSKTKNFLSEFHQIPCETSHRYQKAFPFDWKKTLSSLKSELDESRPITVFFQSQTDQKLYLRVKLNFKRSPFKDKLLQVFNQIKRLDMLTESAILLEQTDFSNSIDAASSLNHEINRATLLLPSRLSENMKLEKDELTIAEYKSWFLKRYKEPLTKDHKFSYVTETDGKIAHHQNMTLKSLQESNAIVYEVTRPDGFKLLTIPTLLRAKK